MTNTEIVASLEAAKVAFAAIPDDLIDMTSVGPDTVTGGKCFIGHCNDLYYTIDFWLGNATSDVVNVYHNYPNPLGAEGKAEFMRRCDKWIALYSDPNYGKE